MDHLTPLVGSRRPVARYITSPHLSSPLLTSPDLSSPLLTSPHLSSPLLTSPHLSSPLQTSPHLSTSIVTSYGVCQAEIQDFSTLPHFGNRYPTSERPQISSRWTKTHDKAKGTQVRKVRAEEVLKKVQQS